MPKIKLNVTPVAITVPDRGDRGPYGGSMSRIEATPCRPSRADVDHPEYEIE